MTPSILDQALKYIIDHPDKFDPAMPPNTVTLPLAGIICEIAGIGIPRHYTGPDTVIIVEYDNERWHYADAARKICGLTRCEARWLMRPYRTMPELYPAITRLNNDLAFSWWDPRITGDWQHSWCDIDGTMLIATHRSSVWWVRNGRTTVRDHTTRQAAYAHAAYLARYRTELTHTLRGQVAV